MSHLSIPQKDYIYKYWKSIQSFYLIDIQRWVENPVDIQFEINNTHKLDFNEYLNSKIPLDIGLAYLRKLLQNDISKLSTYSECREKEIAEKIWNNVIRNPAFINKKKLHEEIKFRTSTLTQVDTIYFLRNNWVDTTELISIIDEHYKNKKIGIILDTLLKLELQNYEISYIENMKSESLNLHLPYILQIEERNLESPKVIQLLSKLVDDKYDPRVIEYIKNNI
jgi:hypothetical protein